MQLTRENNLISFEIKGFFLGMSLLYFFTIEEICSRKLGKKTEVIKQPTDFGLTIWQQSY